MPIKEDYKLVRNQLFSFNAQQHQDFIQTLVYVDQAYIRSVYNNVLSPGASYGFLESIQCKTYCPNLPQIMEPFLEPEASDSARWAAERQLEWGNPRYLFNYWASTKANPSNRWESGDWIFQGCHSVIWLGTQRFYTPKDWLTNNLGYKMQDDYRLGIQCMPVTHEGKTYFPVSTPPYQMPDNRRDVIDIEISWVHILEVSQESPAPLVVYLSNPNVTTVGTGTPQTVTPAQVTLSLPTGFTGQVYSTENTQLTVSVSDLTPNADFFLQWTANNTVYRTETLRADGTGRWTGIYLASMFSLQPFPGTADYSVRIVKSNVTSESTKVNVKALTVSLSPNSGYTSNTYSLRISGLKPGTGVNISWQKNGNDTTYSTQLYTMPSTVDTNTWNIAGSIFNASSMGIPARYRTKAVKPEASLTVFSNEIQLNSSSGSLG